MKMCDLNVNEHKHLIKFLNHRLHYSERSSELRTELNTQLVNVLAKASTEIHQANAIASDAQCEVQTVSHAEETQSHLRQEWHELHHWLLQPNYRLREEGVSKPNLEEVAGQVWKAYQALHAQHYEQREHLCKMTVELAEVRGTELICHEYRQSEVDLTEVAARTARVLAQASGSQDVPKWELVDTVAPIHPRQLRMRL